MRLEATIKNNKVIHSEIRNKFGVLIWDYRFYSDTFCPCIVERFFNKNEFKKNTYHIIDNKKILYLKEYRTDSLIIEESYYKNGNISTRMCRNDLGYTNNVDKPAYQEWYENGLRKIEIYYTFNTLNNPIGPAVSKWKETGYLLRHKYYSHGNKIHRDILAKRMEDGFDKKMSF